jgi:hypothetical protein
MAEKPNMKSSLGNAELDKAEKQLDAFEDSVKKMTLDRMNEAPKEDVEPIRMAQKDIEKSNDIYLKPHRQIGSRERFNENYRKEYEYAMEYVRFIPDNKEIQGETIDLWTKPFAGMPAQEWKVPVGKPVWGPRHLAERIASCKYHRLVMQQSVTTGADHMGQYYGAMAADTTIQRLDATPVTTRKSIFMSDADFKFDGRKAA